MELPKPTNSITPLWIIAAFVTLTETVVGYAVTQTQGSVQIALTAFVIIFALLVVSAFFLVLWFRPYVFYSPSEYGNHDPKSFVEALTGTQRPPIVATIEKVERAGKEPENQDAMFEMMDSLLADTHRQMLILMHDKSTSIPYTNAFGFRYELANNARQWSGGTFDAQEFARKLDGVDLLKIEAAGPSIRLTQRGHEFGQWLIENQKKAEFFDTPYGKWGERPALPGISEEMRKSFFSGELAQTPFGAAASMDIPSAKGSGPTTTAAQPSSDHEQPHQPLGPS